MTCRITWGVNARRRLTLGGSCLSDVGGWVVNFEVEGEENISVSVVSSVLTASYIPAEEAELQRRP